MRLPFLSLVLCALFAASSLAQGLSPQVLIGLESKRARVRISAVIAVSKSGHKSARAILEGMLGDKNAKVRAAAAEGLERLGDPAAIPALEELAKDKSKLVRRVVRRTLVALRKKSPASRAKPGSTAAPARPATSVVVDVPAAEDLSGAAPRPILRLLREQVVGALARSRKVHAKVQQGGAVEGYGLWLRIRSISERRDGPATFVDVRCEMTLVAMPSKALRLQASATAGAGVEGDLTPGLKEELLVDGVKACGPALADDFLEYALARGGAP